MNLDITFPFLFFPSSPLETLRLFSNTVLCAALGGFGLVSCCAFFFLPLTKVFWFESPLFFY